MANFIAKFKREFEVGIEADTLENADKIARKVVAEIPGGTLLELKPEGYVEPEEPEATPPKPPFGRPNGGGSPGTPIVRTEALVDQIAEKAA